MGLPRCKNLGIFSLFSPFVLFVVLLPLRLCCLCFKPPVSFRGSYIGDEARKTNTLIVM